MVEYEPVNVVICPWDDIQSVQEGIELQNGQLIRMNFVITRKDETTFGFAVARVSREKMLNLSKTIKEETNRRLAAPFKDKIYFGEGVSFDWLGLTREWLHDGTKFVPWSDVKDIKLKMTGTFSIKGSWLISRHSGEDELELPSDLPHIELVVQLVRDFAGLSK